MDKSFRILIVIFKNLKNTRTWQALATHYLFKNTSHKTTPLPPCKRYRFWWLCSPHDRDSCTLHCSKNDFHLWHHIRTSGRSYTVTSHDRNTISEPSSYSYPEPDLDCTRLANGKGHRHGHMLQRMRIDCGYRRIRNSWRKHRLVVPSRIDSVASCRDIDPCLRPTNKVLVRTFESVDALSLPPARFQIRRQWMMSRPSPGQFHLEIESFQRHSTRWSLHLRGCEIGQLESVESVREGRGRWIRGFLKM